MSKLQSGILNGNIYNLGAFDECLSIRRIDVFSQPVDGSIAIEYTQINGKYCLGGGILLDVRIKHKSQQLRLFPNVLKLFCCIQIMQNKYFCIDRYPINGQCVHLTHAQPMI